MQKGNIGVTTENIFPVIKKFLYSDHEIFLREMVSNAVDATQKLKTLADKGEFKGELGDLTVRIAIDEAAGTITISDRGIGMTEEEIDKYINQIAFSGVNDFLEKYKDNANNIIGHFGLGFYSSFMVSKKVEIVTRSHKDGAKAVKWSCDGSPAYEIDDAEKEDRGSDIILYIDDDCKEFLEKSKIEELLNKYCKFLPVPVAFGKKTEWKTTSRSTARSTPCRTSPCSGFTLTWTTRSTSPAYSTSRASSQTSTCSATRYSYTATKSSSQTRSRASYPSSSRCCTA